MLFDHKEVRPISCYQENSGVCLSMPAVIGNADEIDWILIVILGHKGIERILPVPLDEKESKELEATVKSLKEIINKYT